MVHLAAHEVIGLLAGAAALVAAICVVLLVAVLASNGEEL